MSTAEQTAIIIPPITATALAVFDEPKAAIAICKSYCQMTVAKDGIGKVTSCRVEVKKLRVRIDKRREEQNAAALEHQRTVNAFAKGLIAEVREIEDYLAKQEDDHEAAKEAARQAKENERLKMIQDRANRLVEAGCGVCGVVDVPLISVMTDGRFAEYLEEQSIKADAIRKAEAEAAAIEAERLEREAQQLFAARLEQTRLDRLQREETERQAEEIRIREQELTAERIALEQERKTLRLQQAEVARQEAIRLSVIATADLADKRQAEAEAEDARQESLNPEIEKAIKFQIEVDKWAEGYLATIGVKWMDSALVSIERACIEIRKNVERGEF